MMTIFCSSLTTVYEWLCFFKREFFSLVVSGRWLAELIVLLDRDFVVATAYNKIIPVQVISG